MKIKDDQEDDRRRTRAEAEIHAVNEPMKPVHSTNHSTIFQVLIWSAWEYFTYLVFGQNGVLTVEDVE